MKYLISALIALLFSFSVFAETILFLGDSLTEGYRLAKEEAFPALIEQELKKDFKNIKVINGGVSGATSASGLKRLDWYLKAKPDFMVLCLGGNDGLRGVNLEQTEKNLAATIEKAQERGITVVLAGMKIPTNMGEPYRSKFQEMYPRLAKKYKLELIPFILDGVGGDPKLNLPDGIHPNQEGHKIIAKTVLKTLRPLL